MNFLQIVAITFFYMQSGEAATRVPRLTLAEPMPGYFNRDIGGSSGAYSFGYDVYDPATGNTQFRNEERYPNGTVAGSYGYVDPLGEARSFRYVADERGYRVTSEKKIEDHSSTNANLETTSTESSITWSRPRKKKPQNTVFHKRKYNNVQPPGYYLLY